MNFKKNIEYFALALILIIGAFFRLSGLGYSHFYGDETKTLYLDKTVSAVNFLLDQRKGPVQFVVAWVMEKLTGGYEPFFIRLPFAIAGVFCIPIFYLLAKKFFGVKSALISTFLFSTNGFYIAFARTAQYQSVLILFGLLAVFLYTLALEKEKKYLIVLSSLSMAISLYCHYDAIFFLIPIISLSLITKKFNLKTLFLNFALPLVLILAVFFVPYVLKGYFYNNTVNYVGRRISGSDYGSNNSLYTIFVYNPVLFIFIILGLAVFYILFLRQKDSVQKIFYIWFLLAFFFFEVVTSNPGTHIHNYILPLLLVSGDAFVLLYKMISKKLLKLVYSFGLIVSGAVLVLVSGLVFVPVFSKGYPWSNADYGFFKLNSIDKSSHQLYLYGFPYYRSWDKVQEYLYGIQGVRGFYTNDSAALAKYYLYKYDLTAPGYNFLPQYYVDVQNNMEFTVTDKGFLVNYEKEKDFFENGVLTATVFKLVSDK